MGAKLFTQEPGELKLLTPVPLTQHPAAVYLASLSEGSVPTMQGSLDAIASILTNGECDAMTLDWSRLRYQHTAAVRTALKKRYAPATTNRILCALRRVLKEAYRLDLMSGDDYAKAADVPNVKGESQVRGRALSQEEIEALMDACSSSKPIDIRDAALIAILRGGGLRREEAVNLKLKHFNRTSGAIDIYDGKGSKDRTTYLPQEAITFVENWLDIRGFKPGPLLCPVRQGGRIEMRHMCPDAVLKIMKRRAPQASVESFSPHDFRRTFCSDLLDAGEDIVTVQKLVGHASPATTAKYDRRGEERKRKAVQSLAIRSKRKG